MKSYLVKFETYDNEVEITTVHGYDKQSALDTLVNCKTIIWSHLV